MKSLSQIILFITCFLAFPIQAESTPPGDTGKKLSQKQQLAASRNTWEKIKKEHKNTYVYTIRKSFMIGNGNMTTIHVKNGSVVKRSYSVWEAGKKPVVRWTETGKMLASNPKGAEILNMDHLYDKALKILLKKPKPMEKLYLKFDDQGILKCCFTVNTMIADDAPIDGIVVSSLKF